MINVIQEKLDKQDYLYNTRGACSEPCQTLNMKIFAKTLHEFQFLTIFAKSFFHLRCLTGFWIHIWWLHHLPFPPKNLRFIFTYVLFFINISLIFDWTWQGINTSERKNLKKEHNFIKCTLQHMYNMLPHGTCSPLSSNKTAQLNSQHCTKRHCEVHSVLHNIIYLKRIIDFSLRFSGRKVYFLKWVLKLLVQKFY